MITKVQNNPEDIYVASGYKEIGTTLEINRQRVVNVISSLTKASSEAQGKRISEISGDNSITDSEKVQLRREMDRLQYDFESLRTSTSNADLGDSDEYRATKEAYDRIYALMYKIINTSGTYEGQDVQYLSIYYSEYAECAKSLQELILNTTAETDLINSYMARVKISISFQTGKDVTVPIGGTTVIYPTLEFDGVDVTSSVGDLFTFVFDNLYIPNTAVTVTSGGVTTLGYYSDGVLVSLLESTSSDVTFSGDVCTIENAGTITVFYESLDLGVVDVSCSITLDSESMPF